jgi:hypothetical protein
MPRGEALQGTILPSAAGCPTKRTRMVSTLVCPRNSVMREATSEAAHVTIR